MQERWVTVPGFNGRYEVSDLGRVRNRESGKTLSPIRHYSGYYHLNLYVNAKAKSCRVHRLVAAAYVPNPSGLPDVNHLDGDKSNNAWTNLTWCTPAENNLHAVETGLWTPDKNRHAVVGVSLEDGVTEVKFESMKAAELELAPSGKAGARVCMCVAGKIDSAYGYAWRRA